MACTQALQLVVHLPHLRDHELLQLGLCKIEVIYDFSSVYVGLFTIEHFDHLLVAYGRIRIFFNPDKLTHSMLSLSAAAQCHLAAAQKGSIRCVKPEGYGMQDNDYKSNLYPHLEKHADHCIYGIPSQTPSALCLSISNVS